MRLSELLLWTSGPSPIIMACQAWLALLSLDIMVKVDKMGLSARPSECL